jgi:preprotein translocase subunit SecG
MLTALWIVYILDCLLLIGIILLQPGEGGDLAAAFGGASSQTAFGARGSATFLQKLTTALAVLFMLLSIVLVLTTNWKQKNIMEKNLPAVETKKPAEAPAKTPPANAPAQVPPAVPQPAANAPANQPAAPVAVPPTATPTPPPAPSNQPVSPATNQPAGAPAQPGK